MENFQITGHTVGEWHPDLLVSFALVKKAAAQANVELGLLDKPVGEAICSAADDIIAGKFHSEFKIDVIQGGAGTSTNMAMNEILANRALEILGRKKGEYSVVNPLDHVNKCQSTNDSYPTALKLCLLRSIKNLMQAVQSTIDSFDHLAKENQTAHLIGMTQLQDAVKMTYYDLFHSYAYSISDALLVIKNSTRVLYEVSLGGTAIGTGIGADKHFGALAVEKLNALTGIEFTHSQEAISLTSDPGAFASVSAALKHYAVRMAKISNDIRLLSSSRFGNIDIPARQAGSSIMPGKVNPVIPEVMNTVSMVVIGNDTAISIATQSGQLQLNAFVPLIGHLILDSCTSLTNALISFEKYCIKGIQVNKTPKVKDSEVTDYLTHLISKIGYKEAAKIKYAAQERGVSPEVIVKELGLL
jgi:aspartate ammonia-lyase